MKIVGSFLLRFQEKFFIINLNRCFSIQWRSSSTGLWRQSSLPSYWHPVSSERLTFLRVVKLTSTVWLSLSKVAIFFFSEHLFEFFHRRNILVGWLVSAEFYEAEQGICWNNRNVNLSTEILGEAGENMFSSIIPCLFPIRIVNGLISWSLLWIFQ